MVSETLNLLCDLSSGYSSGRFLLKLDSVKFMLANHSEPDFPFLNVCRSNGTDVQGSGVLWIARGSKLCQAKSGYEGELVG